jgi:hypothetical protein
MSDDVDRGTGSSGAARLARFARGPLGSPARKLSMRIPLADAYASPESLPEYADRCSAKDRPWE